MIELKSDLIEQYLKINDDIIAIFGSNQCKHCIDLKPKLYELSQQHPEKEIIYIDCDKFPKAADLYDIEELPTVIHFVRQRPLEEFISTNINKIKNLWI